MKTLLEDQSDQNLQYMPICLNINGNRSQDKTEYLIIIEGLFFVGPICCDPSSEPSHHDGSDEGSQHMF